MPRKATGQVIEPDNKQRSWAIRFTAYGKRRFVSLGRPEEGWNRQRVEAELRHVLADVERRSLPSTSSRPNGLKAIATDGLIERSGTTGGR
jgi:hypothetical protein